jgi:hypothetical protein
MVGNGEMEISIIKAGAHTIGLLLQSLLFLFSPRLLIIIPAVSILHRLRLRISATLFVVGLTDSTELTKKLSKRALTLLIEPCKVLTRAHYDGVPVLRKKEVDGEKKSAWRRNDI